MSIYVLHCYQSLKKFLGLNCSDISFRFKSHVEVKKSSCPLYQFLAGGRSELLHPLYIILRGCLWTLVNPQLRENLVPTKLVALLCLNGLQVLTTKKGPYINRMPVHQSRSFSRKASWPSVFSIFDPIWTNHITTQVLNWNQLYNYIYIASTRQLLRVMNT